MDISNLLQGNTEGLSEEEKVQVEAFSENLKDSLIEELVLSKQQHFLKIAKEDKEQFEDELRSLFIFGIKGYNKMSLELLINIYLEEIGNKSFVNLINNLR